MASAILLLGRGGRYANNAATPIFPIYQTDEGSLLSFCSPAEFSQPVNEIEYAAPLTDSLARAQRVSNGTLAAVERLVAHKKGRAPPPGPFAINRSLEPKKYRSIRCKSCADAPLNAYVKEELSNGRHGKESHSVAQGGLTTSPGCSPTPPTFRSGRRPASGDGLSLPGR
jgi:hypothetical protein